MKHLLKSIPALIALSIFFISCEKEAALPKITNLEIGAQNSKTGIIGNSLHLEADIEAEAKIDRIVLTIHPDKGSSHVPASMKTRSVTTYTWEVDSTYTGKYRGVKNVVFHEDVQISSNAAPGEYHLYLMVVDMEGRSTLVEDEFTIIQPN